MKFYAKEHVALKHGYGRRILAAVLCLVMCLGLLPLKKAEAAPQTDALANPVAAFTGTKVSGGSNPSNTYILEVSTGTVGGGGTAENILYFAVHYTTGKTKRTQIIMPGEDDLQSGFELAKKAGYRQNRMNIITNTFGYEEPDLGGRKALRSVTTDQFVFQTPEPIISIDKIQVFGRRTAQASDWACQGLRVFSVSSLYGLDMYGWASGDGYVDFDGTLIAEAGMTSGGGIFRWSTSGGVFNIVPEGSDYYTRGCELINMSNYGSYPSGIAGGISTDGRPLTFVGMEHKSQAEKLITFRLDLADIGGAGFESMAALYASGAQKKLSEMNLCEAAVLNIRYLDIYGNTRDTNIPLMISALGYIQENVGDIAIAGFAQQGESVGIPLMLPDYLSTVNVGLSIGHDMVTEMTGLVSTEKAEGSSIRNTRMAATEKDNINYTCFAIYENVNASVTQNQAVLRYTFEPGARQPVKYDSTTSVNGASMGAGATSYFALQGYNENMSLVPSNIGEKYLITLTTDAVENAGTTGDIALQFEYDNVKGKQITSSAFYIRQYIEQFYGEWPGNVNNFAYSYGLSAGGTVQFIIPLDGVQKFTNVSFRVEGNDEWQIQGMTIAMVKNYDSRIASWEEVASWESEPTDANTPRYMSHLRYSRPVSTYDPCFTLGTVDPSGAGPAPGQAEGTLIQDDGTWKTIGGEGSIVSEKDDFDWEELSESMSYEDTKLNLGFGRERCRYKVSVEVDGTKVNRDDDDCGSANLFYFQLVFENGTSGVVLANQQIKGDAFQTGTISEFEIATNMNYGNVTAVMIIPDDTDTNSNIYDKMKVKSISVELETNAELAPVWSCRGEGEEGLGWVGIEYREPGEVTNTGERPGRSMTEIAKTYRVTTFSYSAKLMFSISTGPYPQKGSSLSGNTKSSPLVCGMTMEYSYLNNDGQVKTVKNIDVIKLMDEYSGRTSSNKFSYMLDTGLQTEEVDFAVSDPNYQFRAGKTDNFIVSVDNIKQLVDMKLQIRSAVITNWNITGISVYLIKGNGIRILNSNGEYDYRYKTGEEPRLISTWTRQTSLIKDIPQIYRMRTDYIDGQNSSVCEVTNINFQPIDISIENDEYTWSASVISREPVSRNDVVNLYIYPSIANTAASPYNYDLYAGVSYIDASNKKLRQASAGKLTLGTDTDGQLMFYSLGLTATNLESLQGVTVETNAPADINAPMISGILQRIRNGVLIETYRLGPVANADDGGTMTIMDDTGDRSMQRVLLQVHPNTTAQQLIQDESDLAIALYFTTLSGQELRSRYIYLTDMGYREIYPGEVMEVDFDLGEIAQITGVELVTMGRLNASFENMLIANQQTDGKISRKWSVEGIMNPSVNPIRYRLEGDVEYVDLVFETAADEDTLTSGTTYPIRMKLGYLDTSNNMQVRTYELRSYANGSGFTAEGVDEVQLLVPRLASVRYIELEPHHNTTSSTSTSGTSTSPVVDLASWKIHKVVETTGVNGTPVTRILDKRVYEQAPEKIFMADIIAEGVVNVILPGQSSARPASAITLHNTDRKTITVDSGSSVTIDLKISGSTDGFELRYRYVDPASGEEVETSLAKTYTEDSTYISDLVDLATVSANDALSSAQEKTAAQQVLSIATQMYNGAGRFTFDGKMITFTPPRNYTGSASKYVVHVQSRENTGVAFDLEVVVRNEENKLADAVNAWNAVRIAGKVTVVDTSQAQTVASGGDVTLIASSGQTIQIIPRILGSQTFTATIGTYDPTIGAVNPIIMEDGSSSFLGPIGGYTTSDLASMRTRATESLASSDAAVQQAAQNLIAALDAVAVGSYQVGTTGAELKIPANYSGNTVYYQVNVTSNGSKLFSVIISVGSSSGNPITEAARALETAITNANANANNSASQESSTGDNSSNESSTNP